jgi:hypothetical protein
MFTDSATFRFNTGIIFNLVEFIAIEIIIKRKVRVIVVISRCGGISKVVLKQPGVSMYLSTRSVCASMKVNVQVSIINVFTFFLVIFGQSGWNASDMGNNRMLPSCFVVLAGKDNVKGAVPWRAWTSFSMALNFRVSMVRFGFLAMAMTCFGLWDSVGNVSVLDRDSMMYVVRQEIIWPRSVGLVLVHMIKSRQQCTYQQCCSKEKYEQSTEIVGVASNVSDGFSLQISKR